MRDRTGSYTNVVWKPSGGGWSEEPRRLGSLRALQNST